MTEEFNMQLNAKMIEKDNYYRIQIERLQQELKISELKITEMRISVAKNIQETHEINVQKDKLK